MRIELADEAREFGAQALRALRAAGGDELVQRAEAEPGLRQELIAPVLERLGAWELAPYRDPVELEAAAALCRSAGYWATPYPVAERLARPADLEVDALVVVAGPESAAALAGLDLRVAAVGLTGARGLVRALPGTGTVRETAFVVPLEVEPIDAAGDPALALTLPGWTLLGMLDRAVELAREHVLLREQFGKPLAEFQSVQFQLTDAEVERRGVEMLARYALWSIQAGRPEAVADALALRLAALEAAETVFRVAHQVHGALGFCDEATLSWLSRHSLPLRRFPLGIAGTEEALAAQIGTAGLAGLFSDPRGV
ncbi:acyl-CoA dehydrogenase family protein [Nocardia jiangsuensis]|uniref:Acyl-CoA dehydrogenase family protein n=1 Tax=Nocardia jiangsuensis TaxID=1691563 RepID=A0ABV8DQH6_9NOCA